MAAEYLPTITEHWIRERLDLHHQCLADVRSLSLPGTYKEKIRHLGISLKNFVRLKTLDLSCNALVSVKGVQHLKKLERLNLYYNSIPSMQEVQVLCKLTALRELDLRLNPLANRDPHYRLHLVHALSNLRKLDDCPVRDSERKAAIMHFSSDSIPVPQPMSSSLTDITDNDQRSSELRVASVNRFMRRLSILDDNDESVLNFVAKSNWSQRDLQTLTGSFHKELESQLYHLQEGDLKNDYNSESSAPNKESAKSILSYSQTKDARQTQSSVPRLREAARRRSSSLLKLTEGPRVTFDPCVEKHSPGSGGERQQRLSVHPRVPAKGRFTPHPDPEDQPSSSLVQTCPPSPRSLHLPDASNPILQPPRLSYHSAWGTAGGSTSPQKDVEQQRGSYRKPLEMLLSLVDKHWTEQRSPQHDNNFLSQTVQILSMMERDVSSREAEVRTLRGAVQQLKERAATREQEHDAEIRRLSAQLEEAHDVVGDSNKQLKTVLEENVSVQKQLIKLEQQYLSWMVKSSPNTEISEKQTEVEELRREVAELRVKLQDGGGGGKDLAHMLQESHRSLVATNGRLLGELEGTWGRHREGTRTGAASLH